MIRINNNKPLTINNLSNNSEETSVNTSVLRAFKNTSRTLRGEGKAFTAKMSNDFPISTALRAIGV